LLIASPNHRFTIEQIGSLGKIVKPENSHWEHGRHRPSAGLRNFRKTESMRYVVAPPLLRYFFWLQIVHWVPGTFPPCDGDPSNTRAPQTKFPQTWYHN
jgi:hypothetical protein